MKRDAIKVSKIFLRSSNQAAMRSVLLGLITQLRASPSDDTFFFSQASPGEKFCFNLPTQNPNGK
jgi:hypothetical protein